ncbi:hypothetical protein, partial [Sansalvadorimonas verongulae]|uniref:hypothetical protein n=1 Tax=Sansalvadorimonas verongulae TaxID=2172824 RepID=UPI001E49AFE4
HRQASIRKPQSFIRLGFLLISVSTSILVSLESSLLKLSIDKISKESRMRSSLSSANTKDNTVERFLIH